MRSDESELRILPVRSIRDGELIYQHVDHEGKIIKTRRLPADAERVVLGETERQLLDKGLCPRQGNNLVSPSHCGRDRPAVEETPPVVVSYDVKGYLDDRKGTGKYFYLQLKAGNSHPRKRESDGVEVFGIREQRWVEYWLKQPGPVTLVIGTFAQDEDSPSRREQLEFKEVRWMEIGSYLREKSENGKKEVHGIEFDGERLDMSSPQRRRRKVLDGELG